MYTSRLWHVLATLLLIAHVQAANLVVYPFESEDPVLGTAVAHAVAEAFTADHVVYGPTVAPTLVPPFLVDGGFYNPAGFYADLSGLGATAMLQSATGADVALNGLVYDIDGLLVLELEMAHPGGLESMTLQANSGDPKELAARAVGVTASLLDAERIREVPEIDLDGVAGARAEAIYSAGLPGGLDTAWGLLQNPVLASDPFAQRLLEAIESLQAGTDEGDPILLATLSLNTAGLNEIRSAAYFDRLNLESGLPTFRLWQAMLLASTGDLAGADQAFDQAAVFPYGVAARHAWNESSATEIAAEVPAADGPALIVYSVMARTMGETELEKEALRRLTRIDPWQVWAFERLSFIAFDEDQALDAGQALAVATRLQPDSDLYWTNLGWAQYLLGLLEQSEESSIRATLLASQQYIAHYNIGLVRTVTGRLAQAIEAYDTALRHDPAVDEAAIEDLENALTLYPSEPAVHYSLGYLLEAAGERSRAARQYSSYVRRIGQGDHAERARSRIVQLEAPAPELQLPGGVRLFLGAVPLTEAAVQAGDPLRPSFEVYTPGEALPVSLRIVFSLHGAAGELAVEEHEVTLPPQTVGFVIDGLIYRIPADLQPGDYDLRVTVLASEDRQVSSDVALTVAARQDPLRALFGYGMTLQSIGSGGPLFDRSDLGHWPASLAMLQNELTLARDAADEVLPSVETGRFAGLSGGAAFEATTEADLLDFLAFIAHPDLQGSSFVFVDTYAQWLLDGAPTE